MEIATGKFKTHCLQILRDVEDRREEVIVTRRGAPIAKVVPIQGRPEKPLFGLLKGTVKITGDIIAPIGEKWNADG